MAEDSLNNEPTNTNQSPVNQAPATDKKRSPKKKLIIGGVIFAVFIFLLLIVGASGSIVPKYTIDDLVPVTKQVIVFSRPVQWEDASYATNLVKDFGLEVNDASIFGDKIVKDSNGKYDIENAAVIFGLASRDRADLAIVRTPEFKTRFEEEMNKSLTADSFRSSTCQTVNDFNKNFNYDYNNIPVSVAIKLNCGLSEAEQQKYNADSIEIRMAIMIANDGQTYMYALIASDESWAKNEPVYFQMMRDLKGK